MFYKFTLVQHYAVEDQNVLGIQETSYTGKNNKQRRQLECTILINMASV